MDKYVLRKRSREDAFTKKYNDIYTILKVEMQKTARYRDEYIEPYSYDYEDLLTIEDSKGNQYQIYASVFKSQFVKVDEQ